MTNSSLRESLVLFGLFKLTQRQKAIMILTLKHNGKISASSMAKIAREELGIPVSSFWFALRDLRKLRLVDFGNGDPIRLTPAGKLIAEALEGVEWWGRE
ncbi:MAG: hypothetical protein J7J65_05120 [Candidatus Korarchaeota archaeon]|nr:hypothetical protein [Candidatus Korarchaeota archaeon]